MKQSGQRFQYLGYTTTLHVRGEIRFLSISYSLITLFHIVSGADHIIDAVCSSPKPQTGFPKTNPRKTRGLF
jgi:hypothetical protein